METETEMKVERSLSSAVSGWAGQLFQCNYILWDHPYTHLSSSVGELISLWMLGKLVLKIEQEIITLSRQSPSFAVHIGIISVCLLECRWIFLLTL